ncbi:undecaprenyl-diphosphate phosphatase [soil metagenome]
MPLWQVVVLGIVQGITEFLPISSTAHLLLVQQFCFGRSQEALEEDPITVVIQLGTLVSALVYFRKDIAAILAAFVSDLRHGRFISSGSVEGKLAKLFLIGSLPAGLAGLLLKKFLNLHFRNAQAIAIVAIVFALVMFLAEVYWKRRQKRGLTPRGDSQVGLFDALFVGTFQAFALMPGGSRSGCTLTAGLFAGLSRETAARFSFLLMLPIMFAAGMKELYDWFKLLKAKPELRAAASDQAVGLLVGTAVSAIVGYLAIAWLLGYLRKYSMNVFVIYRIVLGVGILIYLTTHQ